MLEFYRQRRIWPLALLGLAIVGALTGCEVTWPRTAPEVVRIEVTATPSTQQTARPTPPPHFRTIKLGRGPITESVKVLGRVVSGQEATLYFRTSGQMTALHVETGQRVKAGAVLAELDTSDLQKQRAKAEHALERARVRLKRAKGKSVVTSPTVEQAGVEAAGIRLRLARLALEEVRAGPREADVKAAEAAVASARANLERLKTDLAVRKANLAAKEAELAALKAGPDSEAVAAARRALEAAKIRVAAARAGAQPEEVRAAQVAVDIAQTRLAQLRDAPPVQPADLNAARLIVEQARVNLDKALAARAGLEGSALARAEATVRLMQLAVQAAENRLARLQAAGPTPWAIRLQELAVQKAQNALAKLTHPYPLDVQVAEAAVEQAQAKLNDVLAGPSEEELRRLREAVDQQRRSVAAAEAARSSAEASVAAAEGRLAQVRASPTAAQIKQAESQVAVAESALAAAQLRVAQSTAALNTARTTLQTDIAVLERDVALAKLELAWIEDQIRSSQIVAPFDGKITRIYIQPGRVVSSFRPVITISDPNNLVIQASIRDLDINKLALGQKANISLDAFPGTILEGTIIGLPTSFVSQQGVVSDNRALFKVKWPKPGAEVRMRARLQIMVQHHENALILPTTAIHSVGRRRYVEVLDGDVKRTRNVEIGIVSDTGVEILSGLEEGAIVVLPE